MNSECGALMGLLDMMGYVCVDGQSCLKAHGASSGLQLLTMKLSVGQVSAADSETCWTHTVSILSCAVCCVSLVVIHTHSASKYFSFSGS